MTRVERELRAQHLPCDLINLSSGAVMLLRAAEERLGLSLYCTEEQSDIFTEAIKAARESGQ